MSFKDIQHVLDIENFNLFIDKTFILKEINLSIPRREVTAIMGPSGCGKTSLIRSINRLNDLQHNVHTSGDIKLYKKSIYEMNPIKLRRRVGMVFQKANPFPSMSIYENVISGYILNGIKLSTAEKDKIVEETLIRTGLWDEVKDDLNRNGLHLSGGQQQRLCIARVLAMQPKIILLDEPTSALDPKSTALIERLIVELKSSVTVIMVTHNISQASRVSDRTVFLNDGECLEFGLTEHVFTNPKHAKTEEFLTRTYR